MYPVIDNTRITMKGKKFATNDVKAKSEAHTDLKQPKKKDDITSRRKSRKKGSGWNEERDTVEVGKRIGIKQERPSGGTYDCEVCGKKFKRMGSLKLHQISHNSTAKNGSYQCIGCNEGFKKEKDKQEHELKCERNERESGLECCFCDLICDTPKELRTHENQHRPIRKTKNNRDICICIECRKDFESVSSLKLHMQTDHKSDGKPKETVSIKEENVLDDTSLSNVSNQCQHGIESQDNTKESPSSIQLPSTVNDKPFICFQCGARYKYEKSKIKHELKYHGNSSLTPTEVRQDSREGNDSEETKTSQVSNEDGSPHSIAAVISRFKVDSEEPDGVNDNNNKIPIKEENDCSLPVVDVSVQGVPDKRFSARPHPVRHPIIKKKCIGCDKVFDGLKERDEHELECGLNCFNRKFNCMFCDHPFSKPKALRKHENKHRPMRKTKKYKNRCVCIECNKTFDAIYSLRVHMKKLHQKGHVTTFENKPFACGTCDARFKYENSKFKHEMRYHSADFDRTVGNGIEGDAHTNFNINLLSNTDGGLLVCKLEKSEDVKEEPYGTEDNLTYLMENEVVDPVCSVKTEVNAAIDTNIPSGDADIQAESSSSQPKKRQAKQAVEKKPKKQKTGPFVCNNCEAKFNSPQGLWLHSYHQNMRTKRLSCIGCGKSFKSEKDTEKHELGCCLNQNEYDFNCMFCDEAFATPKLLRNHELQHRPRRRTKNHKCVCIDCRKPFDSVHSLKEHIRRCHKSHVKTEVCSQRSTLSVDEMRSCYVLLKDIGQEGTNKGEVGPNVCKGTSNRTDEFNTAECDPGEGEFCEVKEERDCNTEIAGGGEGCNIKPEIPDDLIKAPAAYLVETELANPEETEGTGSFQCGKCNSTFDSHGKLRYHSYSHRQRTKRLFCIGCGEGFGQSNDRDRHELECDVNGHFTCIFCELPFDTPQTLRNHEKKHRPPKRYKRYKHMCLCAECDRAFDAVFTLKIHIRHMHRGSKEKVKVKQEIEDINFESDLTFEEYKFDGDLKVERFH